MLTEARQVACQVGRARAGCDSAHPGKSFDHALLLFYKIWWNPQRLPVLHIHPSGVQ
jgi:hypothetical protein